MTWAQLRGLGVSRRLIEQHTGDGLWQRIDRGTYWTLPSEPAWDGYLWSALLASDDAAVCGQSAAHLLGFSDERRLPIEIAIPRDRRLADRPFTSYKRIDMKGRNFRNRHGIRCVGVEDTVLDLCDVGSRRDVIGWITGAVQQRVTTPQRLAIALRRRRAIGNRRLIESLISETASGVHSNIEFEYVDRVERPHGLPTAFRQVTAAGGAGYVDNHYRPYGVVVELDGRRWHLDAFRDRRRDNRNTRSGDRTLHYGWVETFSDPCGIAVEVGGLLMHVGWPGPLLKCTKCR